MHGTIDPKSLLDLAQVPAMAVDESDVDRYNLLESTQELELPCRNIESDDQMTAPPRARLSRADVTPGVTTELSHYVSDVDTSTDIAAAAAAAAAARSCEVQVTHLFLL